MYLNFEILILVKYFCFPLSIYNRYFSLKLTFDSTKMKQKFYEREREKKRKSIFGGGRQFLIINVSQLWNIKCQVFLLSSFYL